MSVALTLVAASGALKLKVTSRVVGCGIPSYVGGEDAFDDYLTASGSTEPYCARSLWASGLCSSPRPACSHPPD